MAVYFLRCRHLSRAKGARATRAAAYRAGERIRDERAGESFNHSNRTDVAYKEVVIPKDLAGRADMAWTQDRYTLWNAVEHASLRRNAHLAREWLVTLPSELNPQERAGLARRFAQELSDKYRCAVDLCIHLPRPGGDIRHHHAHLLMTTREVTPDGMGRRTALEMNYWDRQRLGLTGGAREEFLAIREQWARVTNEALQRAGLAARVDHRSFAAQGLDREPKPSLPLSVIYQERRTGKASAAGNEIRARYLERVQARLKGPETLARVIDRQKGELRERARQYFERRRAEPERLRASQLTREERKTVARERLAARRERERQNPRQRDRTTPEESAERWKTDRALRGPGPTAEESARNWAAFRERSPEREGSSVEAGDEDRKPALRPDHDFSL